MYACMVQCPPLNAYYWKTYLVLIIFAIGRNLIKPWRTLYDNGILCMGSKVLLLNALIHQTHGSNTTVI